MPEDTNGHARGHEELIACLETIGKLVLTETLCDEATQADLKRLAKEKGVDAVKDKLKSLGVDKTGHRLRLTNILLPPSAEQKAQHAVEHIEFVKRFAAPETLQRLKLPVDMADVGMAGMIDEMASRAADLRDLPPVDGIDFPLYVPSPMPIPLLGLPWKGGGLRSISGQSLARWQPWEDVTAENATAAATAPAMIAPPCCQADDELVSEQWSPRLAVGTMLRAAPLAAVDGFLKYYHAIGFERIFLFFDKPDEDQEAIRLAEAHNAAVGGVTIHCCTAEWWAKEQKIGRLFIRSEEYLRQQIQKREASDGSDDPRPLAFQFREHGLHQTAVLATQTKDVQARQQCVLDRACVDAWHAGYDWLLHVDIDELLYFPRTAERRDARAFFGAVSPNVDKVGFHNHEVYPCESLHVDDWFTECTLFKVSPHLLADYRGSHREVERAQRRKRVAEGEDLDLHAPAPPGMDLGLQTQSDVMRDAARYRAQAMRELHAKGLTMPGRRHLAREGERARASAANRRIAGDDKLRAAAMSNAAARSQGSAEGGGGGGGGAGRERHGSQSLPGAAAAAVRWEREQHSPEDDSEPDTPDFEAAGFTYFDAHAQGKQAVRLRRRLDPPRSAGPHGFDAPGRTHTCGGTHDPVVLHYANCGLNYWIKKYEVLGDIPNFEDRQSLEGHLKHRAGQAVTGEKDGSWSTHLAARDLVVRGKGGRAALELFYRTIIAGNEYGEAQHLAQCGLIVRIPAIADLLLELRSHREQPRVRLATGPPLPPTPSSLLQPSRWLQSAQQGPLRDLTPDRPRRVQWKVIFKSKIVARCRPTTSSPVSRVFEPGVRLWTGHPRPDGWLILSDEFSYNYILADATALGLGKLLERIEPPELEPGACLACFRAPCRCDLLAEYGFSAKASQQQPQQPQPLTGLGGEVMAGVAAMAPSPVEAAVEVL